MESIKKIPLKVNDILYQVNWKQKGGVGGVGGEIKLFEIMWMYFR